MFSPLLRHHVLVEWSIFNIQIALMIELFLPFLTAFIILVDFVWLKLSVLFVKTRPILDTSVPCSYYSSMTVTDGWINNPVKTKYHKLKFFYRIEI